MQRTKVSSQTYPFIGMLFCFTSYCIIQIINQEVSANLVVWMIGCIVHLGFIPLIFIHSSVFISKKTVLNFIDQIHYVSLPICILGIIQYFSPPSSLVNKYVSDDMFIALVGDHVRITGVFSYISGHAIYLGFVLPFMLIQVFNTTRINLKSIVYTCIFLLGIVNLLMTGSRGAVGMFAINAVVIFMALSVSMPPKKVLIYAINFIVIGLLGYAVLLNTETGNEAFTSFAGRIEGNSDVGGRVTDSFTPFKFLDTSGLIGFGIGTTYAANEPLLSNRYLMPAYWEEESERLVLELGLLGFVVIIILRATIFVFAIKTFKSLSDPVLKQIALVIMVLQIPGVLAFNTITFNWLENVFYWTGVGLLVALNQVEYYEKQKASGIGLTFG